MALSIDDKWQKDGFYNYCKDNTFVPVVGDVGDMEELFKAKIKKTNKYSMNAKNKHSSKGNFCNCLDFEIVNTATEVNNTIYGKEVDNVIKDNMECKAVFMNMPIEERDAEE